MPQAKPKVTAKRLNKVSDSLMKSSESKKMTAAIQNKIGKASIKNGAGDKQISVDKYNSTLSGRDRIAIADKLKKSASVDSANSVRYKALANNKSKKN